MKKAIAIVNRNLPDLTDSLVESLSSIDADIFVLENGSDKDKYSKYANLFEEDSNGLAYGVNRLLSHCLDLEYDYIWVQYNDARCDDPKGFFDWSISQMEDDNTIGVSCIHWGSMWDIYSRKRPHQWWNSDSENIDRKLVSFFDDLSYVISRRALETISKTDKRLTPFFDSTNYTNHYNLLGPASALYISDMKMITNEKFIGYELDQEAANNSLDARGYTDEEWKSVKGPSDAKTWFDRFFPQFDGHGMSVKEKRNAVVREICRIYHARLGIELRHNE